MKIKKHLLRHTPTPKRFWSGFCVAVFVFAAVVHSFLSYVAHWLGCGGRSCRGESESQSARRGPGASRGSARSSSIIKVPASVGRAVLLGTSSPARLFFFARLLPFRLTLRSNARACPKPSLSLCFQRHSTYFASEDNLPPDLLVAPPSFSSSRIGFLF